MTKSYILEAYKYKNIYNSHFGEKVGVSTISLSELYILPTECFSTEKELVYKTAAHSKREALSILRNYLKITEFEGKIEEKIWTEVICD